MGFTPRATAAFGAGDLALVRHARSGAVRLAVDGVLPPPPPPPPTSKGWHPPPPPPPARMMAALAALLILASFQPWVRRGVRFWGGCAPIGATYAVAMLRARREDREETLEALHQRCAPRALALVSALGGGYIKIGQVLANRADVLPEPYVRALGTLHDSVPQRPWPAMARRLAAEAPALCGVLGEVDPVALGAASTGQAHLAKLKNGTRVVLKMQYAGSSSKFGTDFANAARLVGAVLPALKPMVLEARRRFMLEFDYVREAEDMGAVRTGTRSRRVFVPMPYTQLTSTTVLVMEYVPGETLLSATRDAIVSAIGESGFALAKARALGTPPPRGLTPPSRLRWLRSLPRLWWVRRRTRRRFELLTDELGCQMLRNGRFHADPHPGNILLMPDGRLALIDYGQCVRLSSSQRKQLARLIVALAERSRFQSTHKPIATSRPSEPQPCADNERDERVRAAAEALGFRTARMSTDGLVGLASYFFDADLPPVAGRRLTPAQALRALDLLDPIVRIPEEFLMCARVSLLLRGTSQLMVQKGLATAAAWEADAKRALAE